MAPRRTRYDRAYLQLNLDRWFSTRQRVFVYHYVNQPDRDPQWQDLSTTGCRYRGWAALSNFHRGEIWTYPTQKHLMLVKMLVHRDDLIMREDWQKIMRDKVRRERAHCRTQRTPRSNKQNHNANK